MKIKDLGGEAGLIGSIKNKAKLYSKGIAVGIGDDAAALTYNKKYYCLFTTDSLVENVHFSLKYFKPEQIGMKAVEQNVSDIAAMGGVPKYALLSFFFPKYIEKGLADGIINGINKKCRVYKISVIGGNVSRSKQIIISIAMIGHVEKKYLALRSGAKINDLIFCTGDVGSSALGFKLLKNKLKGNSIKRHLEPKSRLNLARKIAKIGANSMIDISDGIASEIKHICEESGVGAVIYADKIPISKNTVNDSKKTKKNALDFALYGGEDFELIFTASKNKLKQLKKYDATIIGEVVDRKYGIRLIKNNKRLKLKEGFDHFK